MNLLTNILIEIGGGIFTSVLFLWILFKLRPRIELSPHIARRIEDGKMLYQIKFYNSRRWFKVFDVRMELHLCKPYGAPGGKNLKMKPIELADNNIWYLSRYENVERKRRKHKKIRNKYSSFAKLVTIT